MEDTDTLCFKLIASEDTHDLRTRVLCPSGIDEHIKLSTDGSSTHYGITYQGQIIAVASWYFDQGQQIPWIRKFAVDPQYQSRGVGSLLLKRMLEELQKQGHRRCYLHARLTAAQFYQKSGFRGVGDIFVERGMQHQRYEREISLES